MPDGTKESKNASTVDWVINGDTRCGPADDWGVALIRYWLAKRSGERAIREARERTAQTRRDRHGRRHRREAAE